MKNPVVTTPGSDKTIIRQTGLIWNTVWKDWNELGKWDKWNVWSVWKDLCELVQNGRPVRMEYSERNEADGKHQFF